MSEQTYPVRLTEDELTSLHAAANVIRRSGIDRGFVDPNLNSAIVKLAELEHRLDAAHGHRMEARS